MNKAKAMGIGQLAVSALLTRDKVRNATFAKVFKAIEELKEESQP